jgi:hypothetical protein
MRIVIECGPVIPYGRGLQLFVAGPHWFWQVQVEGRGLFLKTL